MAPGMCPAAYSAGARTSSSTAWGRAWRNASKAIAGGVILQSYGFRNGLFQALNSIFRWLPSQKGLLEEAPQRHKYTSLPAEVLLDLPVTNSQLPLTFKGPSGKASMRVCGADTTGSSFVLRGGSRHLMGSRLPLCGWLRYRHRPCSPMDESVG